MNASTAIDASITSRVLRIFPEKMNLESPAPDADLFDIGVLDSITFIDLLLHLDGEFGIKCSLENLEIENFRSVNRIAQLIQEGSGTQGDIAV
jgi:methoxymalonate biosynthesis acyl carrier protein